MDKAVEVAKEDFAGIRTGRANPAHVQQARSSTTTARRPRCSSSRPSRRPRRAPSSSPRSTSRRCTRSRRRCATPTSASTRATTATSSAACCPMLTEERRKDYIKLARTKGEDAKVSIRNIRRQAKDELDKLVKDGEVGEDEGARAREGARGHDEEVRRQRRRAAQGQGGRAPRGLRRSPTAHRASAMTVPPPPQARRRRQDAPVARRRRRRRPATPVAGRAATCRPPSAWGSGWGRWSSARLFLAQGGVPRPRRRGGRAVGVWELRAGAGRSARIRVPLVPAAGRRGRHARVGLRRRAARRWSSPSA